MVWIPTEFVLIFRTEPRCSTITALRKAKKCLLFVVGENTDEFKLGKLQDISLGLEQFQQDMAVSLSHCLSGWKPNRI